jgi:hypothetical protein
MSLLGLQFHKVLLGSFSPYVRRLLMPNAVDFSMLRSGEWNAEVARVWRIDNPSIQNVTFSGLLVCRSRYPCEEVIGTSAIRPEERLPQRRQISHIPSDRILGPKTTMEGMREPHRRTYQIISP